MSVEELVAAMKNVLERGYPLAQIKQSFINAGYKTSDVQEAALEIVSSPEKESVPTQTEQAKTGQRLNPLPQMHQQESKKQASKILVIVLIILAISFLAGAAFLGFYWNKIF